MLLRILRSGHADIFEVLSYIASTLLVIFLVLSGSIFKKTISGKQQKAAAKRSAAPQSAPPKKPEPAVKSAAPAAETGDDAEVIAAIMAAIPAMGAAEGKQYRLRSVKQVTRRGGRSVWAQAGIQDMTQPF